MASRKESKNPKTNLKDILSDQRFPIIMGLVLILISFFLLVSFTSYLSSYRADESEVLGEGVTLVPEADAFVVDNALGTVGAYVGHFFVRKLFGIPSYFIIIILLSIATNLLFRKKILKLGKIIFYSLVLMLWFSILFAFFRSVFLPHSGLSIGGAFGDYLVGKEGVLTAMLKPLGVGALLGVLSLVLLVFVFNFNFDFFLNWVKKITEKKNTITTENDVEQGPLIMGGEESIFEKDKIDFEQKPFSDKGISLEVNNEIVTEKPIENQFKNEEKIPVKSENLPIKEEEIDLEIEETEEEEFSDDNQVGEAYDPTAELSSYQYPTLDLLDDHGSEKVKIDAAELERNKNQIVATLSNYKIEIDKIMATVGPTVTLYEIVPAPGVRISKIKNLEDDIALSLAALGIRIIAPIPGKGTIGIEVPNEHKEVVSMKSLIGSEKFRNAKMDLPIAIGKSISNEIFIADLAKMPHLLMAGATGQGKSVGINAILVSLLYKRHPSELKFVMVDPKKVELSIYSVIEKHFLAKLPDEEEAIITDTQKVVSTLNALCVEMDERYELLKMAHVRNLKEYNQKFVSRKLNPQKGHKFLPWIVVVIDEFADLIMTAGKEVEMPIARLAQLARAIGIHLILATQRPSVNIITGTIKANFPARISFKVSSKIDSRTILDAGGAEQLIGRGDMLILTGSDLVRLQCAFVDTPEVDAIVKHIAYQEGYPEPFYLPEVQTPEIENSGGGNYAANERDELFEDAARIVVQNQMGSTSLIQRRLKLGYNRAGRLMDQLEDAGIVGPNIGSKARDVLYSSEHELEQYLQTLRELG